ncbi:histidine decarboxylase [Piscirickettsia litoralis]|uniref:Histidine decarboxylase n=1 Tax=Piscirickettsia litoralis TaxID=1891921 RepID=A0ABX3A4S1_9GAMM|nr:histidine decarboxylase [Piscirickettsia litoralis]ODN42395.1 hypothetical protein BGC07_04925 [Piscirickettsia litoralis]
MYYQELSEKDKKQLNDLHELLTVNKEFCAGYTNNFEFDYSELYSFLSFGINNLGSPELTNRRMATHSIEREVISYFKELMHAPKNAFGYVTTGGTEGNFYSLTFAAKSLPNAIAVYSEHSHYSIPKILDLLKIPSIQINCDQTGEMNYNHLKEQLSRKQHHQVIVIATIGTTLTNAIDDIKEIKQSLQQCNISDFHIHADAAMYGMVLPFVSEPQAFRFDQGADSIAISGHKLIGGPIPSGIVLTKEKMPGRYVDVLKDHDLTISGSRNGITPLFIWYAIKRYGDNGFRKLISDSLEKAKKLTTQLQSENIQAWRNENALSVIIPKPSDKFLKKWLMPTNEVYGQIACLPKLSEKAMSNLISDLTKDKRLNG